MTGPETAPPDSSAGRGSVTYLARWDKVRYVLLAFGIVSVDGKSWGAGRIPEDAFTDGRMRVRFCGGRMDGRTTEFTGYD